MILRLGILWHSPAEITAAVICVVHQILMGQATGSVLPPSAGLCPTRTPPASACVLLPGHYRSDHEALVTPELEIIIIMYNLLYSYSKRRNKRGAKMGKISACGRWYLYLWN